MAALFGRELQQFLMTNPEAKLIKERDFQHSVDCGRTSVRDNKPEDAEMDVEDDQASQCSKRTRSPRRAWYRGGQEVDLRPAGRKGY